MSTYQYVQYYESEYHKELKASYADTRSRLEELCERDRIHRHNLAYLECLAAKYGMDTPLRVMNELQSEQAELAKVRDEIVQLEDLLKESGPSEETTKQEFAAAKEQLESRKVQVEVHEKNIAYLEGIVAKQGEAVPLSLHNIIQEEVERLLLTRRCVVKLDWHLQEIARQLDGQLLPYTDFPLDFKPVRRAEHSVLINEIYRQGKGATHDPHVLRIVGQCALDQNVLCIVTWRRTTCVVLSSATSGPVLRFLSFIAEKTGRTPELLEVPYDTGFFFQHFGDALITQEMRYYSVSTRQKRFDFEFDPHTDLVYINTNQQVLGGDYSLPMWRRKERRKRRRAVDNLSAVVEQFARSLWESP